MVVSTKIGKQNLVVGGRNACGQKQLDFVVVKVIPSGHAGAWFAFLVEVFECC